MKGNIELDLLLNYWLTWKATIESNLIKSKITYISLIGRTKMAVLAPILVNWHRHIEWNTTLYRTKVSKRFEFSNRFAFACATGLVSNEIRLAPGKTRDTETAIESGKRWNGTAIESIPTKLIC